MYIFMYVGIYSFEKLSKYLIILEHFCLRKKNCFEIACE